MSNRSVLLHIASKYLQKTLGPQVRIVNVKEKRAKEWSDRYDQIYIVKYEYIHEPGNYYTTDFLPDPNTKKQIDEALSIQRHQSEGKEIQPVEVVGLNTVIGGKGFGIKRRQDGVPYQIEHNGGVRFGQNVRLGSCVCIDKGTVKDTIIGNNVMIDNLVHIAHNCEIGDGTIIAAGTIFGGSVKVGKNCFIGLNSTIKQHVTIGDQVIVGMGSIVQNDIPDKDIVIGSPAKSIKDKCNITPEQRFRMVGY